MNEQEIQQLQDEVERLRSFVSDIHDLSADLVGEDGETHPDVAERIREELEHLRELVYYDDLTKVLNRRGVYDRFPRLFREALFTKTHPDAKRSFGVSGFGVIFIDLDDFKAINDAFGHDAGDEILKQAAAVFSKAVREFDGVARFGGEEFVLLLIGSSEDTTYDKACEIQKKLADAVSTPDNKPITASFGVAALGASDADELDELIGYADQAMYEAKTNRGKNTVVRFSELR